LRSLLLFVVMLALAGLMTMALTPTLIRLLPPSPEAIAAVKAEPPVSEAARQAASTPRGSFSTWIAGLLPGNLIEAGLKGAILPLLLFTVLFGIAVTRLPPEQREPLARIFHGLAAAMLVCIRWILTLTPIGVFVFIFLFALNTGGQAARVLGSFVTIVS